MNRGSMTSVAIGVVTLAILFILFGGSGGGGAMADDLRERIGSFGSFGGGSRNDSGMNYQKHEREYEADDAWWKSHRESHRLGRQYDEEIDRAHERLGHRR